MKSVFKQLVAVASLVAAVVAQEDLTVNTPINVVVCRPVLFTWEGGEPPYFLTIRPGGQPAGAVPLHDFGEVGDITSLRWVPNLPPNTPAGLDLRDSSGRVAQSADFTILSGTDTSCVGQEPSGSSSSGPSSTASTSASSTSGSSTAVPPVTTASSTSLTRSVTTPVTSSASRSSTVSGSSTASSPATSSAAPEEEDGSASANYAPMALVGLIGAAAVLFA